MNKPMSNKHKAAPNGSSMTPKKPLSANCADAPIMVSEPNQSANISVVTIASGICREANAKSLVVITLRDDHHPIHKVPPRYKTTNANSAGCNINAKSWIREKVIGNRLWEYLLTFPYYFFPITYFFYCNLKLTTNPPDALVDGNAAVVSGLIML